jgi:hypothetical protein
MVLDVWGFVGYLSFNIKKSLSIIALMHSSCNTSKFWCKEKSSSMSIDTKAILLLLL